VIKTRFIFLPIWPSMPMRGGWTSTRAGGPIYSTGAAMPTTSARPFP